ncbi:MAG: cation-transporting P-type ATPase [Oscillospiraceae bacterium]|nr:cation-transporting P-type ATPase [Oscillospiraceae bacterium]
MALSGLSEREAEASRQKYGFNEQIYEANFAEKILYGVKSLSCKLFVIAAMVKIIALLLGLLEITETVPDVSGIFIFAGLAVLCAFLEAVLRHVSEKNISEIRTCARQSEYNVLRSGKAVVIDEKMLAVGDVVYLASGDKVPADGIVADGQFIVDQSEFGILEKIEKTTPPSTFHGNKTMGLKSAYSLYKGSVITEGSGAMKITAIGENVFAAEKNHFDTRIYNEKYSGLLRAGSITGIVCSVITALTAIIYGAVSGQIIIGITEGVAAAAVILAVICICEKNLMAETVAAYIMKKLHKNNISLLNPDLLNSMQDVKVVFTDKFGALTEGSCVVSGFIDGSGNQVDGLENVDEKVLGLIKTAAINTSSSILESDNLVYGGTPVDRAILNYVKKASGRAKVKKLSNVENNNMKGVTVNIDGKLATFFKGRAEAVISRCSDSFSADGKKRKITNKDALIKLAATISLTGNDVIAIAVSDKAIKQNVFPSGSYTFIGMFVVHDKVCSDAGEAMQKLEEKGVKTILITSASRETVIYTLRKTASKNKGVILSSEQLSKMNDEQLKRKYSEIKAIVNANRNDKIRMAEAASEQGLRSCVIGSEYDDIHMFDETDAAISSHVCPSSMHSISDASVKACSIKSAAELHAESIRYSGLCKMFASARIFCAVVLMLMTIISIIGR